MKIIYVAVLLFAGIFCKAQTFGATALDVKGNYNPSEQVTGQWLKKGSMDAVMVFSKTPNGVSDATTFVQRMLVENDMNFEEPDMYNSIEGKDVTNNNNNRNPETLHNSIQKGKSKINVAWKANDGSVVQLLLAKDAYEVIVMNAYKQ
ncbi:MAG: hypothetical protein DI539_12455 [Flavobacterium psychrophilum]|nr:MAG: hypothetical protein DI539_12455 [Flavobacterium psychrophilum]